MLLRFVSSLLWVVVVVACSSSSLSSSSLESIAALEREAEALREDIHAKTRRLEEIESRLLVLSTASSSQSSSAAIRVNGFRREGRVVEANGKLTPPPVTVRVLPCGITDPLQWRDRLPIPSAKIQVWVDVDPALYVDRGLHTGRDDVEMAIELWDASGNALFSPPLVMDVANDATRFELNIGAEAAGHYDLRCTVSTSRGRELATATDWFVLEVARPQAVSAADCLSLPGVDADDGDSKGMPPVNAPPSLCDRYSNGGRSLFGRWYMDDTSAEKSYRRRSRAEIDDLIARARRRERYYYGETDAWLYEALDENPIEGKDVLLIGSNVPWYESICLAFGARECVTLEYNALHYDHPRCTTVTVAEYESSDYWRSRRFNAAFSISSFEHDGLGRYGDPLNPDGDLEAMRKVLNYVLPATGMLFLSVPVGRDAVIWNSNRVYGADRLPKLLDGWRLLSSYGFEDGDLERVTTGEFQPVFVVQHGEGG